ncbi:hypothetical protein FisN_26Lh064 [Fistulifera solaris]|uniref:RING-type domain-containing protein n=1 Tax=Fistulifera solaris TaxID=1519565 RepID=A0A1Z5KD30_FISSO|nr:hypothetical protein FisN_26Lh064 [Fistulifera solaris]|eukprot:GAX24001.1 hypothetical protein FisN_26Lh064 [Fistulifera solaris]
MDIETGNIPPNNDCNECNLECDSIPSNGSSSSDDDDDESSECFSERADRTDEIPCPICFEPCSSTNPLIRSDTCEHAWCQDCLSEYLEFQVSQHRVPLPCPSSASYRACLFHLSSELVRKHLSHSLTIQKYNRLDRLVHDRSLVACPRCDEIVDTPAPPDPHDPHARHCPKCAHTFCSIHADAHLGIHCRDYRLTKTFPQLPNTKPCSHCGAALQKYAGCDHVVCPACHNDMCYKCGTHQHLTGKVTKQCSQCQQAYLDHRYLWHIRLYYFLTLPFALPFALAYVAIMLGLVLVSLCCCGCFGCGAWLYEGQRQANFSRALLYVAGIIFLPLILMLYDVGYHFQGSDEFLEWCSIEGLDSEERTEGGLEVPSTPTTTTSEEE